MNRLRLVPLLLAALTPACARHKGFIPAVNIDGPLQAFETRLEVPTGLEMHSDYAVADFNNDGRVDMAVIDLEGQMQVMVGSGSVFNPGQSLTIGGFSFWIDKGDLDRDGDIDLVVLQKDGFVVTPLWNDGLAQFTIGESIAIGLDGLQVLVADADQDGVLDLLVTHLHSPNIQVFRGDGEGGFNAAPPFTLPGGGQAFTLAVGDPSHDGVQDLVVADPTLGRVLVFAGGAIGADFDAVPSILPISGQPGWCSCGDLDGDGLDDIAVSTYQDEQFVVVTNYIHVLGVTTFTSVAVPIEGRPSVSTIGDVDGDGRGDLVGCVVERASLAIVKQSPGGGFAPVEQIDATGFPTRPVVVDVDRNGRNDLLALSAFTNRVNLWLARANGQLVGARNFGSTLVDGGLVAAVDLDGDGRPEVIAGSPLDNRLAIMRPTAAGGLAVAQTIDLGAHALQIRTVDLDLDGRVDLVVPVPTGVKVVRNLGGAGSLAFAVLPGTGSAFGTGSGPFGATAADLDRDGRLDLAIADAASGDLQILRGGSTPFDFSGAPQTIAIGGTPIDVVAADFTGDGIFDLAVSRSQFSDIVLLGNDGHGVLTLVANLPVGAAPNVLRSDDFDKDGRSDLVVANGDDNTVSVLFGGASGFTSQSIQAGAFPNALLTADLSADGRPDVLVASRLGEDFRLLFQGDGAFDVLPLPGVLGAGGVALADIDGDGLSDLVITNVINNRISVVRGIEIPNPFVPRTL